MRIEMIIVMVLVVVIGVPFTLWWWRIADRWADAEHKRFKVKTDTRERIVVRTPQSRASVNPPQE